MNFPRSRCMLTKKEYKANQVSVDLSSQVVSDQVFSALQSLTTVFGMGTGVPFAFVTLTICRTVVRVLALTYLPGSSPTEYFQHCKA